MKSHAPRGDGDGTLFLRTVPPVARKSAKKHHTRKRARELYTPAAVRAKVLVAAAKGTKDFLSRVVQ